MKKIKFLGLPLCVEDMDHTVEYLLSKVDANQVAVREDITAFKITSRSDQDIHSSIVHADIVNADGMSIVKACKFLYGVKVPRVTGCDLFQRLLIECHERSKRVYFLGATQDSLQAMLENIELELSLDIVAGARNGYFKDSEWEEIADEIVMSDPDIIFIGTPSPKKEKFSNFLRSKIKRGVVMGVGGSFDIVSGKVKRAPRWVQEAGFEWLYRTLQEPKKMWRRYLISNSEFIVLIIREKLRLMFRVG